MTCPPLRPFRRSWWVAVSATLAWCLTAGAQPPATPLPADGTELFRGLLAVEGIAPTLIEADTDTPDGLILVIFGEPERDATHWERLSARVLAADGAVLILSERAGILGGYFPPHDRPGLTVTGERVFCPNPNHCLDGDPWLPFVQFRPERVPSGQDALLFVGLERMAANVPSALTLDRPSRYAQPLAAFPAGCVVGTAGGRRLPRDRLFATWGSGPEESPFRSLVIADPSTFINEMLAATPDRNSDNLTFALRVVRWLRDESRVNRKKCLFVEYGTVRSTFDDAGLVGTLNPPIPVIDPLNPRFQAALTDAANRLAARAEDRNWFNRKLVGEPGEHRKFAAALRRIAGFISIGLLAWLLQRAWSARHSARFPAGPRVAETGAPPVGSNARRELELARSGALTEPVREYVWGLFVERGLPPDAPFGPAPEVEVTGGVSPELGRRVRVLWDRVLGPSARPVTANDWKEIGPMIGTVQRTAAAGLWRVVPGRAGA